MLKKLHMSLIFSTLVVSNPLSTIIIDMHNFVAKFGKILEICKKFAGNLVNEKGNVPRRGVVPTFSDLEVVALSITAEALSIDSENYLFRRLNTECPEAIPNLITRRQYNQRRKKTMMLGENIRQAIAKAIDGGETVFSIDSKPVKVCQNARANRFQMGKDDMEICTVLGGAVYYQRRRNKYLEEVLNLSNELTDTKAERDKMKGNLQNINAEIDRYRNEIKNKEQLLAEKLEENKRFITLLHKAELEERAEDVVSLLPSKYRPHQYADREPYRYSTRHCMAVDEENRLGAGGERINIIGHPHKYQFKIAHNTFFLILYEMGMDDKAVRRIMGITQEAIRILASRW